MDIAPAPLAQVPQLPIEAALEVVLGDALAGRLCELSGEGATCPASVAFLLVREAQRRGLLAAWLQVGWRRQATGTGGTRTATRPPDAAPFFAPDLVALGLDLAALPFIPVQDMNEAGRAATHLLRSGAFALLVIDTLTAGDGSATLPDARRTRNPPAARPPAGHDASAPHAEIQLPLMSRLVGLAQKHHAALIVLTTKPAHSPSLGSLVSFHAHVALARDRNAKAADGADVDNDGFTHLTCRIAVEKDKRRGPGLTLTQTFRAPPGLR